MKVKEHKTERLHALDALRAIMMMLGIVLHATITYIGGKPSSGWPLRDPSAENLFLDWLLSTIHNFRMPIFMLIAGFFAALLFYDRSPKKMIINRAKRILYPFLVFIVLLWPLVTVAFSYSNAVFNYSESFNSVIGHMFVNTIWDSFTQLKSFIPKTTMHLWFLYYLILFSAASFALGSLFKNQKKLTHKISTIFDRILLHPILRVLIFPLSTFGILLIMQSSWVNTSTSFIPDFGTFLFYFSFYMIGWVLFRSKHLLPVFLQYDRLFLAIAGGLFTVYFFYSDGLSWQGIALLKSLTVWLFIFGFMGVFMRYLGKHSPLMRYVSDSAYWVYLLHLPLTAFIPGLIGHWPVPSFVKFLIVVFLTSVLCFATYHYFVRTTFIGKFLNGRKYSRKLSEIKEVIPAPKVQPVLDK
ncbi:acyltransferase family protein [Gaetbulibacter aestuarii]|uniref:Acyltransferase family protein n=1 Tax=Gaetbulibacter aestuarii TaxID=1502358 RepID=A0ABW7MV10_9FLAO